MGQKYDVTFLNSNNKKKKQENSSRVWTYVTSAENTHLTTIRFLSTAEVDMEQTMSNLAAAIPSLELQK